MRTTYDEGMLKRIKAFLFPEPVINGNVFRCPSLNDCPARKK